MTTEAGGSAEAGKPLARVPKLRMTFPPSVFGDALTRRKQRAVIRQTTIPIVFRKTHGATAVAYIDVVVESPEGPRGEPRRHVLQQWTLMIRGKTGQLVLRPLATTVPSVQPEFLKNLTVSRSGALTLAELEAGDAAALDDDMSLDDDDDDEDLEVDDVDMTDEADDEYDETPPEELR